MVDKKVIDEAFVARMRCVEIKNKTLCQVTIPAKLVRKHELRHGQYILIKLLEAYEIG